MKNIIFSLLVLTIPLVFWGWAYEFSYFYVLGLDVYQTLGIEHYIYSSASYLIVMLVIIFVLTAASKFFSKNVDKNDWEDVKVALSRMEFLEAISKARISFALTFGFWLITALFPKVEYLNWVGSSFLLLIFFNLQLFFASLYLSPQYSRFSVVLMFILSVGFCFSTGGIYSANYVADNVGKIRDDSLVTIEKKNGKYIAVAKVINIPLPTSLKRFGIFSK